MSVEIAMGVLKAGADLFEALKESARPAIAQALMTAALLFSAYVGIYAIRDGSLWLGLRNAFASGVVHEDPTTMQAELRQLAASDKMIRRVMQSLLEEAPNASRVRLAVIHDGFVGVSGMGMLRFDVTHAVAAPGRDIGPLVQNQPLSNWGDYVNTLLGGQCTFLSASQLQNAAARVQMSELNIRVVLACPVVDPLLRILGATFISWDGRDEIPDSVQMQKLMNEAKDAGRQLALALDLRPSP